MGWAFCLSVIGTMLCAAVLSLRPTVRGYAKRIKSIILIVDVSPSMGSPPAKINAANDAVRSSVMKLQQKVGSQERNDVELTVIAFSGTAWTVTSGPVASIEWNDLEVTGSGTHIGDALREVGRRFESMAALENVRYGQPVVILCTDGQPTQPWLDGLQVMLATEMGSKCLRLAIGIGSDCDMAMLHEFMGGDPHRLPLPAENAEEIVQHIEFGTTVLPFLGGNQTGNGPVNGQCAANPSSENDFPKLI